MVNGRIVPSNQSPICAGNTPGVRTKLQALRQRISNIHTRAADARDQMRGPRPQDTPAATESALPDGSIPAIDILLDRVSCELDCLGKTVEEICETTSVL